MHPSQAEHRPGRHRHVIASVVAAVATLVVPAIAGCTTAVVESGPPPDPLAREVGRVWAGTPYESDVIARDVTWRLGQPPDGYDGYTTWWAFAAFVYRVDVVLAVVDPGLIAHEGGHVVCIRRWLDPSEECAENIALQVRPPG